jgi:hypothetical protein
VTELLFLDRGQAAGLDLPWPDLYFAPGYGHACELSDGATWELALWEPGPILYPYLMRPIDPALDAASGFDIISPYGYAGIWAPPEIDTYTWSRFRRELRGALRDRGCVAEFLRIGGLLPGCERLRAADPQLEIRHHNDTVLIDLREGFEACWAAAEGRARTKTRKARKLRHAFAIREALPADLQDGSAFRRIYEVTLERLGAHPWYRFDGPYFRALCEALGPDLLLAEVRDQHDTIAVSALAVAYPPFLHLHLAASTAQANQHGANNLLYHGLMEWACSQPRFAHLHIGGGLEPDDRLFYFKRSFGGQRIPFHVGRCILDPDRYRRLCAARAQELDQSLDQLLARDFFPAYR